MANFKIGQKVICIYADPVRVFTKTPLKVGEIYTVEFNFPYDNGVILKEIKSSTNTGGFLASRFRALDEYFSAEEVIANVEKEINEEQLTEV